MYDVAVEQEISAGHQLREYQGQCERCHGHNWKIRLEVTAAGVDRLGLAVDFQVLKNVLKDVLDAYDHTLLNDSPDFTDQNPTSENLARVIFQKCKSGLAQSHPALSVKCVLVWESSQAFVRYYE